MPTSPLPCRSGAGRVLAVAMLAALAACGDSGTTPPGPPNGLTVSAGNNQEGTVGATVLVTPAVRVADAGGRGVPGISVRFDVLSGGGSVTGDSVVTNSDGIATVGSWRLGPIPGTNQLRAQALGYPLLLTITATSEPGAPSSLQIVTGGASLAAVVGQQVLPLPSVRVRDAFGNPIPGALITWQVIQGGGTLVGASQTTTDAEGRTTVGGWILGGTQGNNQLQARTANGLTTTFNAQGIGIPTGMSAVSPTSQSGFTSFAVPKTARVLVVGNDGPVIGVPVVFSQTAGGGTISGATVVTDLDGIAALGDWRLGPDGASTVTATVPGFTGAPVTFTATGSPTPFTIDVRFLTETPADIRDAFIAAAMRWMTVITGDLPSQQVSLAAGSCQSGLSPALNESIDDMIIWASIIPIDGVGTILGQAGPCVVRSSSKLTVVGNMQFDIADAESYSKTGQFKDIALHEMGHVLGFLGDQFTRLNVATGIGGSDPHFTGAMALAAWPSLGISYGGNLIPLEDQYGPGTRDSHWRESILGDELMTGFIENVGTPMPLSAITVGAMADLGYAVDPSKADPFLPALRAAVPQGERVKLNEKIHDALYEVLPNGTVVRR